MYQTENSIYEKSYAALNLKSLNQHLKSWKLAYRTLPSTHVRMLLPELYALHHLNFFQVPRSNLQFGSRSFRASAPTLWNSLPHSVRFCESLTIFGGQILKYFISSRHSLVPPSDPPPQCLRFNSSHFWHCINSFTCLLTSLQ